MGASSNRIGIFASHRGRRLRTVLIAGTVAALTFALFSAGITTDEEVAEAEAERAQRAAAPVTENPESTVVVAPKARPFAVPVAGAVDGNGAPQTGSGSGDSGGAEATPLPGEEEDQVPDADYQAAVQVVTRFAGAYGSYDPAIQSADEWAEAVPGVTGPLRGMLADHARGVWPDLRERGWSGAATPVAQSVTPIYVRDDGSMQLAVSVTVEHRVKDVVRWRSESYAVTLKTDPDSKDGWVIAAVS